MKRYLTSYSKNKLTVRDRVTGQTASESFVDADTAEIIQDKIKKVNYTIPKRKSEVKTMSIDECQDWMRTVNKQFITEFGWIKPDKIEWSKDEIKELATETVEKIKTLTQQLDELLKEI